MALYDIFSSNSHPVWAEKLLIKCNKVVVDYLFNKKLSSSRKISVLEVGAGKGYFCQVVRRQNRLERYVVIDRSAEILSNISADMKICASVPPMPLDLDGKFDLIFVSYVLEHMRDGIEAFDLVSSCSKYLTDNGILVILVPDVLRQKMEFWNMDYTHAFPTTSRNVDMILEDAGMTLLELIPISGLITFKGFENIRLYQLFRFFTLLFPYRIISKIYKTFFFRNAEAAKGGVLYKGYCLLKQENLMFIARKNRAQ